MQHLDLIHEWQRGPYTISTDKARIDHYVVLGFLRTSYWAANRSAATTLRAIEHSVCFGVYKAEHQIGFARVTTDFATIAYLGDVFVVDAYRGQGLAQWLVACILDHPELQGLRRWLLATQDAHGLYAKAGFASLVHPDRWMERAAAWAYDRTPIDRHGELSDESTDLSS